VYKREDWPRFRKVYQKLTSVNEIQTKKTLACSIHEIARLLGPEITDSELIEIFDKFMNNADVRISAIKNMHIFLAEVPAHKREKYI